MGIVGSYVIWTLPLGSSHIKCFSLLQIDSLISFGFF